MKTWLEETPQLDLSHPKLRITAQKLTQCRQSVHARAAAIHAFVRRMPFAAVGCPHSLRASSVLARGAGDGASKGLLFVALCRAAGLPARLLFVRIHARAQAGVIGLGEQTVVHAVGQVRIGERWVSTDGYVVDPPMFAVAKQRLLSEGMDSGWGIVLGAPGAWDGRSTSIQRFRAADLVETLGVFSDVRGYVRACGAFEPGWLSTVRLAVRNFIVNRRVARLRKGRAPAQQGPARAAFL